MKFLVTGASGFVGRYVVSEALRRGHCVRVLIRPATATANPSWADHRNVELVRADLRSKRGLVEAASTVDAVLHLAVSQAGGLYALLVGTVVGTENLLEAMKQAGVSRIVLVSSFAVYNYSKLRTYTTLNESCAVETEPQRRDYYCLTKLMQENLVRAAGAEHGLRFTILRPGAVFGKEHVWTARLGIPLSDRIWIRMGRWAKLPLSYVENCAEAIVMCAERDEAVGQTFNVVDDETPTQQLYSHQLQRRLSPPPHIITVPWTMVRALARIAWIANRLMFDGRARLPQVLSPASVHARFKPLRYSNQSMKKIIGWRPRYSLAEALDRSFAPEAIDEAILHRGSNKGFSPTQTERDNMKPALTVVIPTFNRVNRLKETLEFLIKQSLDKGLFEIVVVDDGSDDETAQMVTDFSKQVKNQIRYFWQENKSAGSARNLGIVEAKSPIVLLMDDDIIPNKDHLKLHLELHLRYPEQEVAIRGRIIAGQRGVDLLRWDGSEIQAIGQMTNGEPIISPQYFVTADVSLKRQFLIKAGLFTPGLPVVEDMDLADRLKDLGLKMVYCREAVAVHTEPLDTLEKVSNEGRKYGRAFAQWNRRIPLYGQEIWRLGARVNGGWPHFKRHPWGYLKDSFRRWSINEYTIKSVTWMASRIAVTNPPKRVLRRLCKEIWAYHYRHEFYEWRRRS
jgi:nucleoside-diphosphate-sugar epimerase/glycosyltransferase involved in cell wall biosynthesis